MFIDSKKIGAERKTRQLTIFLFVTIRVHWWLKRKHAKSYSTNHLDGLLHRFAGHTVCNQAFRGAQGSDDHDHSFDGAGEIRIEFYGIGESIRHQFQSYG